jgi:hypothetical protein
MTFAGALGVGVVDDPLDLADVGAVLLLLLGVHRDREGLDDGPGEDEADLFGGAELAIGVDDGAQVVEVAEADDGAALFDVEGGVEDLAPLDPNEAIDELLGIHDAGGGEGGGIDELDQVVEFERAVLSGGSR